MIRRAATGTLTVALPPAEAFALFTPRGEQRWVPGWTPHFPAYAPDDTAPGTVFTTNAAGALTTWLVIERIKGTTITYARVLPDTTAGTVQVTVHPHPKNTDGSGGSEITVTYDLTALTPQAAPALHAFFDGYSDYLKSWQQAISTHLATA